MNTKADIKKVCAEIIADLRGDNIVIKERASASERLEEFERLIRNDESNRVGLIGRLMVRQELYPELAVRILPFEILDSLEVKDLQCVIDSYNISEEQIALKLSGQI